MFESETSVPSFLSTDKTATLKRTGMGHTDYYKNIRILIQNRYLFIRINKRRVIKIPAIDTDFEEKDKRTLLNDKLYTIKFTHLTKRLKIIFRDEKNRDDVLHHLSIHAGISATADVWDALVNGSKNSSKIIETGPNEKFGGSSTSATVPPGSQDGQLNSTAIPNKPVDQSKAQEIDKIINEAIARLVDSLRDVLRDMAYEIANLYEPSR